MAKKALTFFEAKEHFPIATYNSFNALAEFMDEPKPGDSRPRDYASIAGRTNTRMTTKGPSREIRNKRPEVTKSAHEEDSEDTKRRKRNESPKEINGTALNNPQKTDEHEQWKRKLEEAKAQQDALSKMTINHAIQEALQRYYSAIIADINLKGQARENLIETSKKYLSFDVIHKN